MKTKLSGILTLLLAFTVQITFAQEKTITGVVSDESGPLPGVSVLIEGTSKGTETDFDGNYSISAESGQVLRFSFVGMTTVTRTIGIENVINVTMASEANALDEVVVTALGVKREKQALGYAVSTVDEEMISERGEGDIGRVLLGKAAGLQVQQQSGMSGSGTSILIRGMNSFSGSNQPLFIVDGVPFSSETNAQGDFVDGNNGSSRFLDIDPNNIESVNVLRGLAAATLYGTQGRNGVILITTKGGSSKGGGPKKTEISVLSSLFFNEIASMPNYQNEYGNGFDQAFGWFFSNWGPSFAREGPGGWGNSPAFDENGTLPHPYSTASPATGIPQAFPEFAGARYEWRPYNPVRNFFRTGIVSNINVNARGASEDGKINYNVNYGNMSDEGFTPGNKLNRNSFSVGGRAQLSNKFTVNSTLNYTKTTMTSPPVAAGRGSNVAGEGASIFANLFYTPRSIDLNGLPFQNPVTGGSVYYRQNNSIQNPWWTVNNAGTIQDTYRIFGSVGLSYEINENLSLGYQFGLDAYNENNVNFANRGGVTGSQANRLGRYQTWTNTKTIDDHNFTLNGNYTLTDFIDLNFTVGSELRRDVFDRNGVTSTGQLVYGVLRHFNFQEQNEIQFSDERNIVGAYGNFEFGLGGFAYVTLAGRNDWVSNLAQENRSIFYPSASVSFIPTKIFEGLKGNQTINYLKFRVGYGTSANFPTGYPIASVLSLNAQAFQDDEAVDVVTNTTGTVLGNPNLRPETIGELEFGVEARLFKNRVSLDASYYIRTTNDLIVNRPLDPSTGYTVTRTNVGAVENKGIEIDLGLDIFRSDSDGFNWSINTNWFRNEAIVTDLGLDTDIVIYERFGTTGNAAIQGQPMTTIIGTAVDRDDNGNMRVNAAGTYVERQGNNIIGDANPDWNLNISNSISYKNFNFGFLFTWVQGGDMMSWTAATLLGRGVIADRGVSRENSFILPGVNPAGEPNTTQINNSTYYFSNILYGPDELRVYDATVYRLQEVSLGYSLPSKFLDRSPIGGLSFTFSGYNLWFNAPNFPANSNFDPNVAGTGVGNGRGMEFLNGPSGRRYGLTVKVTF